MESTATVTELPRQVEQPRHFADCDSLAIGRRIKMVTASAGSGWFYLPTRDVLTQMAEPQDEFRGECQCFALQLTRVEADLAARRKAQRAGYDRAEEIAALTIARDALRAVAR